MTCSLNIYRQRIGTYYPASIRKMTPWKKSTYGNSRNLSFRIRLKLTLIMTNYLIIIFFLPMIFKNGPHKQDLNPSIYSILNHPTSTAPLQQYLVTPYDPSTWEDTGVHNIFKAVEPGIMSATSVFLWMTRAQINKLVHTMQGNRGQRGRGITCLYWNKGPSLLTNKQADIKSIIADHKPHILGLGEANFKNGQDLDDVAVPVGYDRNRIIRPEPEPEPEFRFRFAGTGYGFRNSGSGMKEPNLVCSKSGSGKKNQN